MKLINNFSLEQKFLQKLLFDDEIIDKNSLKKINPENLVKFSSTFLILPSLYVNLKKNKLIKFFPADFLNYLNKIYKINLNRNNKLLRESDELSQILKSEKIDFRFIKGISYCREGIYDDLGERMIGDIDILVKGEDFIKTINLLNSHKYFGDPPFKYMKNRHAPRLINSKKLGAIEVHKEVLLYSKKNILPGNRFFKNKSFDFDDISNLCILNFQINDYGHLYASYSFKACYDLKMIRKFANKEINFIENTYVKRFFLVANKRGFTNQNINLNFFDKLYMFRINYKQFKPLKYIDNTVCCLIKYIPIRIKQILEFCYSKFYRNKIFKFIRSKYLQ
tara:strand:- start:2776 stop:3783 length:1008 start_codon:yes stop_codon:yes gene_type:complete